MAYEDLLNNKCSIYHLISVEKGMGYGIKAGSFDYPAKPDLTNIPCHFNISDSGNMQQTENANEYTVVGKLQLPAGTEIYVNDMVVDLKNGISYTAEIPKNIRGHHVIVNVQRKGKVKSAL